MLSIKMILTGEQNEAGRVHQEHVQHRGGPSVHV